MQHEDIRESIRTFIENGLLGGADVTIEPDTPLLELGIITSLSTMRLLSFIREQFGVEIPMNEMTGSNFRNLTAITTLVADQALPEVHNAGR
jgi:acyl carrier protein